MGLKKKSTNATDYTTNEGTIQIKMNGVITSNSLAKIDAHRSSGSIH
jgi:hypothetical protein